MDHFRVRVWAIIGPANAGKSSVIGAMVSQNERGAGGRRDVLQRGGGWLRINAFRRSIQEANISPEDYVKNTTMAARKIQKRQTIAYYNLLLALRSDNVNGYPPGSDYLEYFVQKGWFFESIVLLNMQPEYDKYATFGALTCEIVNSSELIKEKLHRNWVFGQVRNHFAWA